jgi:hypothetical protein
MRQGVSGISKIFLKAVQDTPLTKSMGVMALVPNAAPNLVVTRSWAMEAASVLRSNEAGEGNISPSHLGSGCAGVSRELFPSG